MRTMRRRLLTVLLLVTVFASPAPAPALADADRPNIVIIFADDLGYADIGSYGATGYATPNLDRLAREGVRLTDFYVAQAVCSASRAALLTGRYSHRVGITGALTHKAQHGLPEGMPTMADVARSRGYATAIVGKWHLGHLPAHLPLQHGFDEYYGLPYSNDMWPHHPLNPDFYPALPLIEGSRTIDTNPDQSRFTTDYTRRAVDFISRNAERPFLLYLAHTMPHVPLFVSERHRGTTARGLYGDVIAELDWSAGEVLRALGTYGLETRTLVIFTSDNGPWTDYGDHAGSVGPLRGSKATTFEGGVRVPFLARWQGRLAPGRILSAPAMTIDIMPTVARLTGAAAPAGIDGADMWPLLTGETSAGTHDTFHFFWGPELQAIRQGRWKLHLPHDYKNVVEPGTNGAPGKAVTARIEESLFDLENDPGERTNVAGSHPQVLVSLRAAAARAP
jgi:arylsulfatase A